MAWEWSHTDDAYDNAYTNLSNLEDHVLADIWGEWEGWPGEGDDLCSHTCELARHEAYEEMRQAITEPEVYVDRIWEKAAEQRICDNGGHRAWVCPYGCHTVSFDKENSNG